MTVLVSWQQKGCKNAQSRFVVSHLASRLGHFSDVRGIKCSSPSLACKIDYKQVPVGSGFQDLSQILHA